MNNQYDTTPGTSSNGAVDEEELKQLREFKKNTLDEKAIWLAKEEERKGKERERSRLYY